MSITLCRGIAHLTMKVVRMSGPNGRVELPSYFKDNPWVDILAQRGQEVPGASSNPTLSTAEPARASLSPIKASSVPQAQGQEIAQLINALMGMVVRSSQAQVAQAQAQAQSPTVIVVPIVIQVPSYGYPMSIAMPNGGHGGLAPHLNAVYECSAKPLGASPPGFKSPPRRQT